MRNLSDNSYDTIDEMWVACVEDLINQGERLDSRDGPCRELLGYSATLLDPSRCLLHDPVRDLDPYYAAAECMWYLSGTDRTEWLEQFAPQYARMVDDHVAYGAYGKRLFENSRIDNNLPQIEWALRELKSNRNSRQVVVDLHEPRDLFNAVWHKQRDIPCTLSVQLLLRQDKLHMVVTMRSNDVWLGMPYDVFWWCTLLKILSCGLGCAMGRYYHRVGSMHLYDRNHDKAQQATTSHDATSVTLPSWRGVADSLQCAREHAMWLVYSQLKAHDAGRIGYQLHEVCQAKLDGRLPSQQKVTDQALWDLIKRRANAAAKHNA